MTPRNTISCKATKDYMAERVLQQLGIPHTVLIPTVSDGWHPGYPKIIVDDLWFYAKKLSNDGSLFWSKNQRKNIIEHYDSCYVIVFTSDYLNYCIQKIRLSKKNQIYCRDLTFKEMEMLKKKNEVPTC